MDGGAGLREALRRAAGAGPRRLRRPRDARATRRGVFGPQKGATPAEVRRARAAAGGPALDHAGRGGGAAGGLGAALASLGAELAPGAALVLDAIGFDSGRLRRSSSRARDASTRRRGSDKAPGEVARRCLAAGVRCVVFGGIVDEPLAGVETIALSGDPARATEDLRRLGRALARGSGG